MEYKCTDVLHNNGLPSNQAKNYHLDDERVTRTSTSFTFITSPRKRTQKIQ